MNRCFCRCGREHEWAEGSEALCRCGKVLEPQTHAEFQLLKQNHEAVLERMAIAVASCDDLEPLIRFFRD
jgi:hypothetical protein